MASIIKRDADVVQERLADFGTTKPEIMHIVQVVVAAANDATAYQPKTASGQFKYIYGTGALRELFVPKGWSINRNDNIESVYSPETGIKIVFQNVDSAADPLSNPKAISGKGPAAERLIETAQYNIFPEFEEEDRAEAEARAKQTGAEVYFLCVSTGEGNVRAELSKPKAVKDGQFSGFDERIFIIESGEWGELDLYMDDDDETVDIEEPEITKK